MAALDDVGRVLVWISTTRMVEHTADISDTVIRDAIRAAVDAVDDWVDLHQVDYNAVLPEPFASFSTSQQKTALLMLVISERLNRDVK